MKPGKVKRILKCLLVLLFLTGVGYHIAAAVLWNTIDDTIRHMIRSPVTIYYQGEVLSADYIYSDIYAYLTIGERHRMKEDTITSGEKIVIANEEITVELFDMGDDIIYLHPKLNDLIHPAYQIEGSGTFRRVLEKLSDLTGEAVFES